MPVIQQTTAGIVLSVRVIPRARTSGIDGTRDHALLIRVDAPPVEGAANDAVVAVLARTLGIPKRSITILSGARGRLKRVQIAGISADAAIARLPPLE